MSIWVRIKVKLLKLRDLLYRSLSSTKFTWVVIGVLALESLWVALSIQYPALFDEKYHFRAIQLFTQSWWPVIYDQPRNFDDLGNLTYGNVSIYHYLLSFPLRALQLLSVPEAYQIIALRLFNITMACGALVYYVKTFDILGVKRIATNLGLFVFIMVPFVTLVTGAVSYDNAILLLTGMFFYYGLRILRNKDLTIDLFIFISLVLLACLIKFTFIPIGAAGVFFVIIIKRRKLYEWFRDLSLNSFMITRYRSWIILAFLGLVLVLFFVRYGVSTIQYGTPLPACEAVMEKSRCIHSGVFRYEQEQKATKDERYRLPPEQYMQNWTRSITQQTDTSAGFNGETYEFGKPIPVNSLFQTIVIFTSIATILLTWHLFRRKRLWAFIALTSIVLVLATFYFNITSYRLANVDLNVQIRYFMSLMPVLYVAAIHGLFSTRSLNNTRQTAQICIVMFVMLCALHGGGVMKHIITSQESWYWNSRTVRTVNSNMKEFLSHITYESQL